MNKQFLFLLVLVAAFVIGCAGNKGAGNTGNTGAPLTGFSDVTGKEWKLLEVHVDSTPFRRIVLYDRDDLKREEMPSVYTLSFSADQISGMGAPNRYTAPYRRNGQTITIQLIRSTLMAPLVQPEKLQEHVFFGYLQNAYEWKIAGRNLEILSKTEDGSEVRLVFGL